MEHSHRGKVFDRIRDEAEQACRDLAGISDDYEVLFLQGGASLQFSMVPMNLLPADRTADYLLTGVWSQKAVKEAKILGGKVHLAASGEATNFDRIPTAPRRSSTPSGRPTSTSPPTTRSTAPSGARSRRCPRACRSSPTPRATCTAGRSTCSKYGADLRRRAEEPGAVGRGAGDHPEGSGRGGAQDAADHAPVPDPRGGEVALQHAAHVRDLRDGRGVQVDPERRAGSPRWPSTTQRRPGCSTTSSTRATSSAAPRSPTAAR